MEYIIGRTRILRWLGQENEKNVARTKNCCGWPSSPSFTISTLPSIVLESFCVKQNIYFLLKKIVIFCLLKIKKIVLKHTLNKRICTLNNEIQKI